MRQVLGGHSSRFFPSLLAFRPDGTRLATTPGHDLDLNSPGEMRLWDPATGQELLIFRGHSSPIGILAFRPDGTRLAAACADGSLKVWDGSPPREPTGPKAPALTTPGVADPRRNGHAPQAWSRLACPFPAGLLVFTRGSR